MKKNEVKRTLDEGGTVVGTFVKMSDPASVEIMGKVGFDFFVLDTEHVGMNKGKITDIVRAGELNDIAPILRVREGRPVEILQALDTGAHGVQIPNIDDKEDVQVAIENAKYAPEGQRGFSPSVRAADYGLADNQEYVKEANKNTLVVGHCESKESMENLDEILAEDQLDVMFIGPMDLSQSLGITGQGDHPKLQESMDKIVQKTREAGKAAGMVASNAEGAKKLIDKGVRYVMIGSDQGMMSTFARQNLAELEV